MNNSDIADMVFREAVEAIDCGNIAILQHLLETNPELATKRLETTGEEGYFKNPYLLWLMADNPIRQGKLPANIVEVTDLLIEALQKVRPQNYQEILDFALGLVATGRTPKECGVQIPLMERLTAVGASVGENVLGAIGQRNFAAAEYLLQKGAVYNLAAAVGLDKTDDAKKLAETATVSELYVALVVASFFGRTSAIEFLIETGADPNGYGKPEDFGGFHAHASALHQAVYSGSIESVKRLVAAGASLTAIDSAYQGTPLDWASHMQTEESLTKEEKRRFEAIANFLRSGMVF